MIDIHSHILWGLDDGASERQQSLDMLAMAAESGTTAIVASPHADDQFEYQPGIVDERIRDLSEAMAGRIEIYRGCDFHLSVENVQDALVNPAKYVIHRGPYLLVEFSNLFIPPTTDDIFRRFLDIGVVPVITHPERNPILQAQRQLVERWVNLGCLVQVTAQSLTDRFGKMAQDMSWSLLNKGLVHVLASDAHDTVHRPPRLDTARDLVTREFNADLADLLLEQNPGAIVMGQETFRPEKARSRKPWYQFW